MRKRIFINFFLLILLCATLLAVSISAVVYYAVRNAEKAAIRDKAILTSDLLNVGLITDGEHVYSDYSNFGLDAARVTIIAPDGRVLVDNKAVAASLANHADREEFIQAKSSGSGEITRFSNTLQTDTFYYATLLNDGNVLRVSDSMSNISKVFGGILPVIITITLVFLLLALYVAHRLTEKIIRPLEWIDFEGENIAAYDELIPYMKRIDMQKKELSEKLSELSSRAAIIEDIIGNMREGLILLDKNGEVLIANKAVSLMFGETTGKNIMNLCRDMDFRRSVNECLSGSNAEVLLERDGRIFTVYFNPSNSSRGGAVILFVDVTARSESEKQRREFSANVSHELKTPLTSISAYAELIENGMAKEEDIKGFASKIYKQTQRLIYIINDIIRLSEFDEGDNQNGIEEFSIYELAKSVVEALRIKAKEKDVFVSVQVNAKSGTMNMKANKPMIDELLYNLVDNAIKYNRDGGFVNVDLSVDEEFWIISVADCGAGIAMEHQLRVFERFYRVDKSRDRKTGGTGLGLSIVKHIAEHHGGRVELQSAVHKGTKVTCWIPRV